MDALTPLHTAPGEPVRGIVAANGSSPSTAPASDKAAPAPGAMAFVFDEQSETVMRQSFANLGIVDERIFRGGIDEAMGELVQRGAPRLLVVDVSGMVDPMVAVARLSEVCDPATEVVIVGDRNDIVLYRDMKAAGVAEYFFKPLISSVMTRVLGNVATGSLRQQAAPRSGKLVVVLGVRGGVGATTIATQAAWHLAEERQRRVLLLDLDLQSGDAALQLDVVPTDALSNALDHPERVDDLFLDRGVTPVSDRFSLFAAFESLAPSGGPSEEAVLQLVATLTKRHRFVLVDLPPLLALQQPKLLEAANTILLVGDGSLVSAREVARWRDRIGPNTPDRTTLHVLNKKGGDGALPEPEFERAVGRAPDVTIAYDREVAKAAILGSKALHDGAAMKRGMAALTRELAGGESEPKQRSLWNRMFG